MRLDEGEIDVPGAEGAGVTDFGARQPHGQGLALPMPVDRGNLSLNKPVIRWMSG